jgi:hypothetical protein
MTPDERQMIDDLFARLAQQASPDKDTEADRLIADRIRRNPDAAYMLVQTVLVYEHQMAEAQARIADLEAELANASRPAPAMGGGSFLGGRIGAQRGGAVPPAARPWGRQSGGPAPAAYEPEPMPGRASSGFGRGGQSVPPYQQQPMPAQGGGGFLRGALATAAGVAGGMMLANSLGGLFGGDTAQASEASTDANAAQDAAQDAEFDAGGGDFDGGIDI